MSSDTVLIFLILISNCIYLIKLDNINCYVIIMQQSSMKLWSFLFQIWYYKCRTTFEVLLRLDKFEIKISNIFYSQISSFGGELLVTLPLTQLHYNIQFLQHKIFHLQLISSLVCFNFIIKFIYKPSY
jgi:hypothetical protein